jgi:predicted ATPase/transcriptional regulator with XRE-family HTH domain
MAMHQRENTFGEQLRQFRLRVGLSQAALAEQANLSIAAVTALERGARNAPYPRTLDALATALELSPQERADLMAAGARGDRPRRADPPSVVRPVSRISQLPIWLTSLVGRAADVDRVRSLLSPSGSAARLLTLLGPGGVGKTRLACTAAAGLSLDFPDGIVFVDLAPLRDARLVPVTIARALQVRESGSRSARELLLEYLAERRILLVLDNFEHLLEAAPAIAELVSRCPSLGVLVTSRAALRVQRERRYAVLPLALPDTLAAPCEPAVADWPAVELFMERARAAAPDFAIQTDQALTVARICRRLDGVPLAIELAAARVPLLGLAALLRRLERRLPLLTAGAADLPERQRTLRGTLAWSHDLLEPAAQVLFRRLAVFAGGWTVEAVEAVCTDATLPADDVLDRLQMLVDCSLVCPLEETDDQRRFGMLETVREYAAERLVENGEAAAIRGQHRDWCLSVAEAVPPEQLDPSHIRQLTQEQDNLRAALRACVESGDTEAGLRLGVALWPMWYVRGLYTEGRAWLGELLTLPRAAPTPALARVLTWAGHLAACQGESAEAEARFEEALTTARGIGAEQEVAVALLFLAHIPRARGEWQRAEGLYQASLEITRRRGDRAWEMFVLDNLALLAERRGDATGTQAAAMGVAALALARAVRHQPTIASMLGLLGRGALGRREYATARQLLEESAALQRAQGFQQALISTLSDLAWVAVAEGNAGQAGQLLAEGLVRAWDTGDRVYLARVLDGMAALVEPTRPRRAVRLAGTAAALRQAAGIAPLPLLPAEQARSERWQAAARRALGDARYADAWAEGQRLSWEQAKTEALALAAAAGAVSVESG